jgi:phosphoglycolate phosphatase
MKRIKARGIIFDLDGTLVDSLKGIAGAANMVLRAAGFSEYPVDRYREFVGRGLHELIKQIIPGSAGNGVLLQRLTSRYRQYYRETWLSGTVLYPGIKNLLTILTESGMEMAVLSNKSQLFVEMIVEKMLGGVNFREVMGSQDSRPKKPDPKGAIRIAGSMKITPEQILMVGDTVIDMNTAERAGMVPIGVQWGFHTPDVLRKAGAAVIIKKPRQILKYC